MGKQFKFYRKSIIILMLLFISIYYFSLINGLNVENINVIYCQAEDALSSSNTWSTICDNTYPGNSLFYDDDVYETNRVRKVGSNQYWAGLYINSSDSSIIDCININAVFLCYKWWASTTDLNNCYIAVDSDEGNSFTNVTTYCPSISEPTSITCINITSLENWRCNNFFGNEITNPAKAKSELKHNGSGSNGYYNVNWDVFYFNVSYTAIPKVNLIVPENNFNHTLNTLNFSCNVTSSSLSGLKNVTFYWNYSGIWTSNETFNVTGNNNISNFNKVNLSNGNYIWNCYACDEYSCRFADNNRTFDINYNDSDNSHINSSNITLNNSAPKVFIIGPEDNTVYNYTINSSKTVIFNFNVNDDFNSNLSCSLYLDGLLNTSNSSFLNNTLSSFVINDINLGPHYWQVNCSDENLSNKSELYHFTIQEINYSNYTINVSYPTNILIIFNQTNSNLKLTWNLVNNSNYYNIYYSDYLCDILNLNLDNLSNNITTITNLTSSQWIDNNISDSNKERYYRISAVNGNSENISLDTFGKYTYQLYGINNDSDDNYRKNGISIIFYDSLTAEEFLQDIPDNLGVRIKTLNRSQSNNYNYLVHNKGSIHNFILNYGYGYEIEVSDNINYTLVGKIPVNQQINLYGNLLNTNHNYRKNWINVNYCNLIIKDSQNLLNSIPFGKALKTKKLERNNKYNYTYLINEKNDTINNYLINFGNYYEIEVSDNVNYTIN